MKIEERSWVASSSYRFGFNGGRVAKDYADSTIEAPKKVADTVVEKKSKVSIK